VHMLNNVSVDFSTTSTTARNFTVDNFFLIRNSPCTVNIFEPHGFCNLRTADLLHSRAGLIY